MAELHNLQQKFRDMYDYGLKTGGLVVLNQQSVLDILQELDDAVLELDDLNLSAGQLTKIKANDRHEDKVNDNSLRDSQSLTPDQRAQIDKVFNLSHDDDLSNDDNQNSDLKNDETDVESNVQSDSNDVEPQPDDDVYEDPADLEDSAAVIKEATDDNSNNSQSDDSYVSDAQFQNYDETNVTEPESSSNSDISDSSVPDTDFNLNSEGDNEENGDQVSDAGDDDLSNFTANQYDELSQKEDDSESSDDMKNSANDLSQTSQNNSDDNDFMNNKLDQVASSQQQKSSNNDNNGAVSKSAVASSSNDYNPYQHLNDTVVKSNESDND